MIISKSESSVVELSGFLGACAINLRLSIFRLTFIVYLFRTLAVAPVIGGLQGLFFSSVLGELVHVMGYDVDGFSLLNFFTALYDISFSQRHSECYNHLFQVFSLLVLF